MKKESNHIILDTEWKELLCRELGHSSFVKMWEWLDKEKNLGKKIFPPQPLIFNAFNLTSLENLKVVILGQDPYHKQGAAMGLSFSVPRNIKIPPSLKNIYKEIQSDIGVDIPTHGDLTSWAEQGVLLLNATLTVECHFANSHQKIGWQKFTDQVISFISNTKSRIVFMLWGANARSKVNLIDQSEHLVLQAAHPSPLARGAFFGSRHFSQCNEYLISHNIMPIDWKIK